MHPHIAKQLADERFRELCATAQRSRRAPAIPPRRRRSARYRAGWALIEIGLRLARTPGDA